MKLISVLVLGLFLPTLVSAQSVEVNGDVASQVDPAKSTVTASPTSLPANGTSVSVVTVTLRNSSNNVLPNIEVTLTSSRGGTDTIGHYVGSTLTPGNSYTSDSSGIVKFGVRSSTIGAAQVTAVAESLVTLNDKPTITFTSTGGGGPGPVDPDVSSVVADPTSLPADNVSLTTITVTLRDKDGNIVDTHDVSLESSRGATDFIGHYVGSTLVEGSIYSSDANGVVVFASRSSTPGNSTFKAVAIPLTASKANGKVELTDKPVVTFTTVSSGGVVVDPDRSTVIADPTSLPADGKSLTTVTVTLRDSDGNPLDGKIVKIISSRGGKDSIGFYVGSTLTSGDSYISDTDGVVKFGVSSSTVGDSTYTVIADSDVTLRDKPTVKFKKLSVGGTIRNIINKIIEQANDTTNKALAGLGAITTIALLPTLTTSIITALLQQIPLINFLLTSWLPIRKKRRWGTVRDKRTGVPVAGVQVELFKIGGTEPYLKYRTDQTGQYGFLVSQTGQYFLSITSPLYHDYKSEVLAINDPNQIVSLDIPLAVNEAEQAASIKKARRYMDWAYYLNYFSIIMACVGTIVSIYVFYTEPTLVAGLILALYAVIWSFKLYYYIRYRYYGLVVDERDSHALPTSIIQLTGERQGIQALVHSTISDSRGRFLFIVKPAKYSMIVAKDGYEPAETEVDEKRLSQTIRLHPSSNNETLAIGPDAPGQTAPYFAS